MKKSLKVIHLKKKPDVEKMSRPRIELPNFKEIRTRQDQEVQPIETNRQKQLYGRKVANAWEPDRPSMSNKDLTVNRQPARDKDAKRVANTFNRTTLGLSAPTQQGAKAAALVGKQRSKFEDPGPEYKQKLEEHQAKKKNIMDQYRKEMDQWRQTGYDLPWTDDKAVQEHQAKRPKKPRMPRRPPVPKVDTKNLSPEQAADRGRAVDATTEHEGFHNLSSELERHHGKKASMKFINGLIQQHDINTVSAVGAFISDKFGYKMKSPKFAEEVLAHARDILVNPQKREKFKEWIGEDNFKEHFKNLKRGHQKAYEYAKNLQPADLGIKLKEQPQQQTKIAAERGTMKKSEIFKAFMESTSQVFKNDEKPKPKLGSHFIFSAENPYHKDKNTLNLTHEQALDFLKQKGYKAEEIKGKYGNEERSIIVHNPPKHALKNLMNMSASLGQDSSIFSDGENHEMHFHHGDAAGRHIKGSGTQFHQETPKDFYSTMTDGTHFTHNFDFDNAHDSKASIFGFGDDDGSE